MLLIIALPVLLSGILYWVINLRLQRKGISKPSDSQVLVELKRLSAVVIFTLALSCLLTIYHLLDIPWTRYSFGLLAILVLIPTILGYLISKYALHRK